MLQRLRFAIAWLAVSLVCLCVEARAAADASASEPASATALDEVLHHFAHVDASRSLVDLLPLLPFLDRAEEAAGRLLAATALSELGLHEPAIGELRQALTEPAVHAAATLALCRIYSGLHADRELFELLDAVISWSDFRSEDLGEVASRAARAAYRQERFSEARRWLERVPAGSSFAPFATYLAAQTEFAVGDTEAAIATAEPLLRVHARSPTVEVLRSRAAIFLGDLYTELGRYADAVDTLRHISDDGPFADRARRDLLVAEGLRQLAVGEFEDARPIVDRLQAYLGSRSREVAHAVSLGDGLDRRVRELRSAWPPRFSVYERRDWAVRRARAVVRPGAAELRAGLYPILVSLPVIWRFQAGGWKADPWLPEREATSRFFFPPDARLANLLQALTLLEDAPAHYGTPCSIRAATAMRQRIAIWLLGEEAPLTLAELERVAARCELQEPQPKWADEGHLRLRLAIVEAAERLQHEIEREGLAIEMAIGQAYLRHVEELDAARKEAAADSETGDGLRLRRDPSAEAEKRNIPVFLSSFP